MIYNSLLSSEFLNQYKGKRPNNAGKLFEIVYLRTYSRWLEDKKRRETWAETCKRVVDYSMSLYTGECSTEQLTKEAEFMFKSMFNLEVLPAGRTMWIGGTEASQKFSESNFNCSLVVIDHLSKFHELFHMLLCGCGVGFRVLKEDVAKLPKLDSRVEIINNSYLPVHPSIRENYTTVKTELNPQTAKLTSKIIVGDSKEGWVEALKIYISLLEEGLNDTIEINYDNVRPQGERIKTFGGRAAGPQGLWEMFTKVEEIVKRAKGVLNPVDAMDICNLIALNVVVGGTRRSSQIALGSYTDEDFLDAKLNLWSEEKKDLRWRVMSNNSIVYDTNQKPTKEELKSIFERIANNGEPGFFNLGAAKLRRPNVCGLNPCFAAGTMVLTKDGHFPIEDLVGKTVTVWDGQEWRTINNFRVTGENVKVQDVTLSSGQVVSATPYHSFILEDGSRKELKDLTVGDKLATHLEQVHGSHKEKAAYLKGFLVAEGTLLNGSNAGLLVYSPKYVCVDRLIESGNELEASVVNTNAVATIGILQDSCNRRRIQGLSTRPELSAWCGKYKLGLPIKEMLNWSLDSKMEFIAGLMDGDGSASDTANGFMYQLSSISKQLLKDVQILLRSVGVVSKLSHMYKEGIRDFGTRGGEYLCRASYRLTISQIASVVLANMVKFERLTSFADKKVSYVLSNKEAIVTSVSDPYLVDKVYCCTVPDTHSFALSNGLLVGQCAEILLDDRGVCNLSTVVLTSFLHNGKLDMNGLSKAFRLATRIGMRQTNVTLSMPGWDEVQKRDRLTGVSMTGVMDTLDSLGIDSNSNEAASLFNIFNKEANNEADLYSYDMRIPRPLLVTAIKPEGTLSLLPTVSFGLHKSYAPYYIRRIRVSSIDPVCAALRAKGVPNEPDKSKPDRIVFSFPIKTSATKASAEESAIDQLKRYYMLQDNYTDHNSSCTLYFTNEEIEEVVDTVFENWDKTIAIAFLPKYTGAFPQMPMEEITKEQYIEMEAIFPDLSDLDLLVNKLEINQFEENDLEDPACATGACPVR